MCLKWIINISHTDFCFYIFQRISLVVPLFSTRKIIVFIFFFKYGTIKNHEMKSTTQNKVVMTTTVISWISIEESYTASCSFTYLTTHLLTIYYPHWSLSTISNSSVIEENTSFNILTTVISCIYIDKSCTAYCSFTFLTTLLLTILLPALIYLYHF